MYFVNIATARNT